MSIHEQEHSIDMIERIVYQVLENENILKGEWHLGKIEKVVSPYVLSVYIDGSDTAQMVRCNPQIKFLSGEEVYVVYINNDPKNKFVISQRATGTENTGNTSGSGEGTVHTHTKSQITDFVEADYVHTTKNENVNGIKTFSSFPYLPSTTPSISTQAANKLYVDQEASKKADYIHTHTTDQVTEGQNKYFTDERAQDAVGTILIDTPSIDFTYLDASNQIKADVRVDNNTLIIDTTNNNVKVKDSVFASFSHNHPLATQATSGFFDSVDKTKLDGIASNATKVDPSTNGKIIINGVDTTVYTHPTADGYLHVPANGTTNNSKVLKSGASAGSINWGNVDWLELTNKPTSFTPSSHSHVNATTTSSGFMSASDKIKLDGLTGTVPVASTNTLGGIKVGSNLSITADGILSASSNPSFYIVKEEEFTATEGQTDFIVQTGYFDPSLNTVSLFIWGERQPNTSFTKPDSTTVRLKVGVEDGTRVLIEYIQLFSGTPFPVHGSQHLENGSDPIPNAVANGLNGLLSGLDKAKLDGISTYATFVENSTTNGNIKINGAEATVYAHPSTHPATVIVEDSTHRFVTDAEKTNWNGKASTSVVTTTTDGLMSSADKTKLNGIASNANNYTHPSGDGNLHVPATSTTNNGKFLKAGSTAGSISWQNVTASDVGLGNVTNESKATMFTSPSFTGVPTTPTATSGTNTTQIASTAFVQSAISTKSDIAHTHSLTVNGDATGLVTLDNSADTLTLTLTDSGVVSGSYTFVTVNSKGQVISATMATATDIGTSAITGVSGTNVQAMLSDLKTQINGKQAIVTGAATTVVSSNLTASRAVVTDASGKLAASTITTTQLGYLSGVTSNVQTQIGTLSNLTTTDKTSLVNAINEVKTNITASSGYVASKTAPSTNLLWVDLNT